jgi:hypothetical protein
MPYWEITRNGMEITMMMLEENVYEGRSLSAVTAKILFTAVIFLRMVSMSSVAQSVGKKIGTLCA